MKTRRRILVLSLLTAVGCAGAQLETAPRAAPGEDRRYMESEAHDEDATVRVEPRQPEPLDDMAPADPYTERAGGESTESAPVELAFAPPHPDAPLASPRPTLPRRGVTVAFVAVRDGQLAPAGRALLDFERAVQAQPALDLVTGLTLGEHDAGADKTADVRELAAVASAAGRDLLVVDLRDAEGDGEVLVVHTARGQLIQRTPRGREPSSGTTQDLYDALALAAAGLEDEG